MSRPDYLLLLAGMALATYLPRAVPLLFLANRHLPRWLVAWLDLIPAAILGALLAPTLVASATPRQLDLLRPELLAALPTFAVAALTRSLGGTVLVGMASYWLVHRLW